MVLGYDSTGFVYGLGESAMMRAALDGLSINVGRFRLNCSSVPVTPSDTATFGYINPPGGSTPGIDLSGLTPTITFDGSSTSITYGDLSFTLTNFGGSPTVYSWFIGLSGAFELWWGGNLPTPYVIPAFGGTLVFDRLTLTLGSCVATGPYVLDTFTGTNSTALTAHLQDFGPGWLAQVGTFWIQGNKATGHSNNDSDLIVTGAALSDYQLRVDVVPYWTDSVNFDHVGTTFRYSDSSNFWLLDVDGDQSLVRLVKIAGGVFSFPAQSSQSIPSGSTHTIGAICHADTISVTWDGSTLFSVVDSFNQTARGAGFRVGKIGTPPAQGTWDNFRIDPL